MPSARDLEAAKRILEQQCEPAPGKHIDHCFGRMLVAWQVKWTDAELSLQRAVWREALGHIPADLWTQATIHLIQHHKFGMPKPAHFMEVIGAQWQARSTSLARLKTMMGGDRAKAVTPFQQEPRHVRLRTMVTSGRKHGRLVMAVAAERELAGIEGRSVEAWALAAVVSDGPAPRDAVPTPPDSPAMQQRLLPGRIRARAALMGEDHPGVLALRAQLQALEGEQQDQWEVE